MAIGCRVSPIMCPAVLESFTRRYATRREKVLLCLGILGTFNLLLFYPSQFLVGLLLVLVPLYVIIGGSNAFTVSFGLLLATVLLEIVLRATGLVNTVYYRPHERFALYDFDRHHPRYASNVDYRGLIPHGDLIVLAVEAKPEPEPREVEFRTDEYGFRNRQAYQGEPYVAVGDSFIAGSGTTQRDIVTEQLRELHGIPTYNLAHPGGAWDYVRFVDAFVSRYGPKARMVLFLFEGNDLPAPSPRDAERDTAPEADVWTRLRNGVKRYRSWFKRSATYRYIRATYDRLRYDASGAQERVELHPISDSPVGFYKQYIAITRSGGRLENPILERRLATLREHLALLVFIPTKYRVYCEHIVSCSGKDGSRRLPNRRWEFVQRLGEQLGIPTLDLTPDLAAASNRLLVEGELTFWRDDTHWNHHGMGVAATQVADKLRSLDAE